MVRCRIFKLLIFLLALAIALTMAEDSSNKSAERKDVMRTARCEHHDHDEKPPSKWLAKFKKTKHYGPSKSQHRQKTHYGQPQAHIRPPPQYVRTQTNYNNIPSFHPPAIPPPTSYPQLPSNPNNFLPQHSYSPVLIYSSPPQVQSFNHPAHLPLAPTEAPPYPQDPEDVEGYSLHALVHNPLVPHSQVPVSPVNLYGYPSQEQNFNRPAQHSLLVSTEAPILFTYYSNAPSHQDLGDPKDYGSPTPVNNNPTVPLSSVTITHDGYPSQAQNFNLPPDSFTEAPVPSTHTNTPYRQDPVDPQIPTVSVNNPSTSYSPSQVPVSPASYVPPSPNHLEIRDPDPSAITPVSTEATVNQTSYNHPYSLPTTTPNSQDAAKTEKVPYVPSRRPSRRPSKAPTYAPSTYSSPVTTERTAYTFPSYSDFENPSVSSTPAFYYPSPATTSYDPSTYSPPVTEAPAYFPPYFGDDFDAHSFDDPDPEPEPLGKPTFFPSYDNSPLSYHNPSFFEESQNVSPPVYSEEPFRKANSRPSAKIPADYYSNEDEKDDAWKDDEEEEFFQQQGKFPRFDEFVKQMMSIGRK